MKVAVGSENPTKINATKIALQKIFPNELIEVIGLKVSSDIPDQPMSASQTITGATNRAKKALQQTNADLVLAWKVVCRKLMGNGLKQAGV